MARAGWRHTLVLSLDTHTAFLPYSCISHWTTLGWCLSTLLCTLCLLCSLTPAHPPPFSGVDSPALDTFHACVPSLSPTLPAYCCIYHRPVLPSTYGLSLPPGSELLLTQHTSPLPGVSPGRTRRTGPTCQPRPPAYCWNTWTDMKDQPDWDGQTGGEHAAWLWVCDMATLRSGTRVHVRQAFLTLWPPTSQHVPLQQHFSPCRIPVPVFQ